MKNKILIIICLFFLLTISVSAENKKCVSITGDGKHIGDEIACGTEHFYVVSNDDGKIKALAKYNLEINEIRDAVEIGNYHSGYYQSLSKLYFENDNFMNKIKEGYSTSGSAKYFDYDEYEYILNKIFLRKSSLEQHELIDLSSPVSDLYDALKLPEVQKKIKNNWIIDFDETNNYYDNDNDSLTNISFMKSDYYKTKYLLVDGIYTLESEFAAIPEVKSLLDKGYKIHSRLCGEYLDNSYKCTKHVLFFVNNSYLKYDKYYQLKEHNDVYDEEGNLLFPVKNVYAFTPYVEHVYKVGTIYYYFDGTEKAGIAKHDDSEIFDANPEDASGPFFDGLIKPSPYQNIDIYYFLKAYIKTLKENGYAIEKIGLISADEIYNIVNKDFSSRDDLYNLELYKSEFECTYITNIKDDLKDYSWLFTENYWTRSKAECGSSMNYTYVTTYGDLKSPGYYASYNHYGGNINDGNAGIRPLIMIDADNIEHSIASNVIGKGKVNVSLTGAAVGEKITFSSTPEKGYTLGKVKVFDEEGNEIEVIDNSFIMPASNVTVEVEFIKEAINPNTLTFISLGTIIAFIISMSVMLIIKRKKNYSI